MGGVWENDINCEQIVMFWFRAVLNAVHCMASHWWSQPQGREKAKQCFLTQVLFFFVLVIFILSILSNVGPVDFGMSYNGERLGAKFSQVLAIFSQNSVPQIIILDFEKKLPTI